MRIPYMDIPQTPNPKKWTLAYPIAQDLYTILHNQSIRIGDCDFNLTCFPSLVLWARIGPGGTVNLEYRDGEAQLYARAEGRRAINIGRSSPEVLWAICWALGIRYYIGQDNPESWHLPGIEQA